jgi:hypothetical protein
LLGWIAMASAWEFQFLLGEGVVVVVVEEGDGPGE